MFDDDIAKMYEGEDLEPGKREDLARMYEGEDFEPGKREDLARMYEGDTLPRKTDDSQGMEYTPFDISGLSKEELFKLKERLFEVKEHDKDSGYSR